MDREEAINIVRKNIPHLGLGATEMTEALESLIPELRESEDERIGNVLYCIVRDNKEVKRILEGNGISVDATLAYLEKQKEQKQDSITKYVYSKEDKKFIQDCANILIANDFAISAERLLSMFEQKPAEWSEEDADMLNCCISSIEESKENRYAYKETDGDTSYDREIAWLKSIRPSWKPSEVQIGTLERICSNLHLRASDDAPKLDEIIELLKRK